MFSNGTRWTEEPAPETPAPRRHRRTRDWLSTGVGLLGVVALAIPIATPTPTPVAMPTPTPTSCGSSLGARVSAATAGSTLDLTGCTYTAGATVNKALTIIGGTLRFATGTIGLSITHNDVTIDGMTIIGTQYAHWANDNAILVLGSTASPLTGVVIRNNHISSVGKTGIQTKYTSGSVISNNTVEDAAYTGIVVFSAAGGSITGNTVRRIGYTIPSSELPEGSDAYGIMVNDQGGAPSADVMVSGNTVEDVPTWHGLDTHGGQRISFINNIVRRVRRGLFITGSPASGAHATGIVVTGNQLLSPSPLTDPTTAVTLAGVYGATFTGNTITGWGPNSPTSAQPWFDFQGQSTGLTASGNTVTR
jgi:parallel beta-helix repeat protein